MSKAERPPYPPLFIGDRGLRGKEERFLKSFLFPPYKASYPKRFFMAGQKLISVGYGNFVITGRVVSIVNPASSPMRRLREDARQAGRLVDATQGRKTRSIIITDSNHVILSAVLAETLVQRLGAMEESST